jgi:hypothetical protein
MNLMNNPWLELAPSEDSYVLNMDRKAIDQYNNSLRDPEAKVLLGSIPEPFIGNPKLARVVLLNLNPGHSQKDQKDHRGVELQKAMFHNLRHEPQEYPFYPLNLAFKEIGAAEWWRPILRKLKEEPGLGAPTIAKGLLVVEWFPYHSKKSALPTKLVYESQKYSFQLARLMLEQDGVLGVGMRSMNHWVSVDRWFGKVPFLKNRQRPWITRDNMDGGLYGRIVDALKGKALR